MQYHARGRRRGGCRDGKASVLAEIAASGLPAVLLDDGRLRASAQLRGQSVTVVERDADTVAAQRRRKRELGLDHVTVVHADVFAWLQTADVTGTWVWLDVEASTIPTASMRDLSATAAGAVTLAARAPQSIKRRVSTLRACFPRFRALDGYQRPGGMVMYTLSWGRRPVADADFDYHVRRVRLFRGRTGAKAIEIQWWGYPRDTDRYAYYLSRRVSARVQNNVATVTLPHSCFAAPAVGGW